MLTINDEDFLWLVQFVRERYGINLEHKRQLIDARLSFEIKKKGYSDFSSYVSTILRNPGSEECQHMINRLSTNYTFFFRESEYIGRLCGTVLQDLAARGTNGLRIWCAACSSGEEPYSVAMVLEQQKSLFRLPFEYEIIGSDINTEMLAVAKAGKYALEELDHIPDRYRHFTSLHTTTSFEIADSIRRKVKWQYKNLMDDPAPQEKYDIVFCRNVMIYFTPELRRKITRKLHTTLAHGGYLFTGATESVDLERQYFRYITPSFYQNR